MGPPPAVPIGASDPQAAVLEFLGSGRAFADGASPVRIDTHAATVFLSGASAWKLKRAVRFDYLDFSTPPRRRQALEAELRLNRRTAPALYRAVRPLTRDPMGRLAIDGAGEAVDWLLEMRRFPDDALLETMADRSSLDPAMLMRLADTISSFHAIADVVIADTGAARFQGVIDGNTVSMAGFPAILDAAKVAQLGARLTAMTAGLAALLDLRGRDGRVRHGHGDLHLANIALIEGEPTLFDCLEFSIELASVDVLYDLAFLLMDLWQRGLRTEANIVFNRYLDLNPSDEGGIVLMPLFLAVRATIRAHVLAAQGNSVGSDKSLVSRAGHYLDLAIELLKPIPTRVLAIGGLSGTGKSTLARALGGHLGRAPGARILRSDVLRKGIAGIALETPLPAASYSTASSVAVYAELDARAAAALAGGQAVVADAVFARRRERDAIAAVAADGAVAFDGLWLEAATAQLVDRITSRGLDASDADARVASAQSTLAIGDLGNWRALSAQGSPGEVAAAAFAALNF